MHSTRNLASPWDAAVMAMGLFVGACGGTKATGKPSQVAPTPGDKAAQAPAGGAMTADAKEAYDRGWRAWLAGDLPAAKQAFLQATQKDAKAPAPHYSLGVVLERLGDTAGAQQQYRAAFTAQPDFEGAIGAYALSLANSGHVGEADTFLTDKHQRMPRSALVLSYLAEVKSIAKDSGSAQQYAQEALRIDPESKAAMVVIARDHYRARRTDLARYALQAILDGFGEATPARDKDNVEAHLLRGLIERETGRRALAMTEFETVRRSRPDLVEATLDLGAMKLEAGNVEEAMPLLESAVRYAPNNAIARLNLGDCYRLAGRPADAKRELDTALSLDSSLAAAHYNLGLLFLFAPTVPGVSAGDQVGTAIKELETYKAMRGGKAPSGVNDDIDDLLNRAKQKQADMKNTSAAAATRPAPANAAGAPTTTPAANPPKAGAAGRANAAGAPPTPPAAANPPKGGAAPARPAR